MKHTFEEEDEENLSQTQQLKEDNEKLIEHILEQNITIERERAKFADIATTIIELSLKLASKHEQTEVIQAEIVLGIMRKCEDVISAQEKGCVALKRIMDFGRGTAINQVVALDCVEVII